MIISSSLGTILSFVLVTYSEFPGLLRFHYGNADTFNLSLASIACLFIACETYVIRRFSAYGYIERSLGSYYLLLPIILFLFGTYIENGLVQFISAILAYLMVVAVIGGKGCALLVSPALLFTLFPLIIMTASVVPLSLLFFSVSALLFYLAITAKRQRVEGCDYCSLYRNEGRNFCLYCGRCLNKPPFMASSKKIIAALIASVALLVAFQVNAFVYTQADAGVAVKMISLGMVKTISIFPVSTGVTLSTPQLVKEANISIYIYNMSYNSFLNQSVYLTFAHDPRSALSSLLSHTLAKTTYISESGQARQYYAWNESGILYLGLTSYYPVYIMQGRNISVEYAAILVGEDTNSFSQERGETIKNFLNNLNNFNSHIFSESFFVPLYSNYLLNYSNVVEAVALVAIILLLAYLARTLDYEKRKIFDNSLSLKNYEFSLFAKLSEGKKEKLGLELLQSIGSGSSEPNWREISRFIERLRYLNLVDENIVVISGEPRLAWRFRV